MTLQFKLRSREGPHEQCEKQITLLKEYNHALEKQNQSRNIQRKALQAEIQRLSRMERELKEKGTIYSTQTINILENKQYIELKQQYSQIKTKYQSLVLENSSLTARIINSDFSSSRIATYESQKTRLNEAIKGYETKISSLQSKIYIYQREISDLKRRDTTSTTITRQYQSSVTKLQDLQRQIRLKNESISKLERQASSKDLQLSGFKRDIANYSQKIDRLSEQLSKLERSSQKVEIRYVQKQDTSSLRAKLEQLNTVNGILSIQNNSLRVERSKQTQHTRDLERRIAILQQANFKLQNEAKIAIQAKTSASRIVHVQQDKVLKEAVYSLKAELEEVRNFNQLVRQQNDQLYAKLQQYTTSNARPHCNRCHRNRSRSPIKVNADVVKSKLIEPSPSHLSVFSHTFQANSHSPNHASQSNLIHSHTVGDYNQSKSRMSFPKQSSQSVSERYNDLQRKIQMLQSQNQVLKHHLVHEI